MARRAPLITSVLFVVFALAFSLTIWPDVSAAAKLAFFATGAGFGIGVGRMRGSRGR